MWGQKFEWCRFQPWPKLVFSNLYLCAYSVFGGPVIISERSYRNVHNPLASQQERPQTVGVGETQYAQNANAADLGVAN